MNSRWLIACTLLCAIILLPLSLAHAQDYDAVGKRLRKAVRKGEVTKEQAAIMMEALKKAGAPIKKVGAPVKKDAWPAKKHSPEADLEAVRQKPLTMVKDGKLTKEEAKTKGEAIKKDVAKKKSSKKKKTKDAGNLDQEALAKELKAAVKAGKLTEEEAKARMAAAKKKAYAGEKGED